MPIALEAFQEYLRAPSTLPPLVRIALIHYQFEAIHPFPDGNGRVGRILNILYLISEKLLDVPILYLSRYIIEHKRVLVLKEELNTVPRFFYFYAT